METLMLLFVFFATVLLAQIIAKFLCQKQEKALKSIYKTLSYITLVFFQFFLFVLIATKEFKYLLILFLFLNVIFLL
jgi:L-asparagine transporter-like permease